MRAKQLANLLPAKQLRLFTERITFSKLTTAYFLFSLIHCIIQAALQIRAFTINRDAANFLYSIAAQANATDNRVPALGDSDLRLCSAVPTNFKDLSQCQVIWDGSAMNNTVSMAESMASSTFLSLPVTSSSTSLTISSSLTTTPTPVASNVSPVNGEAAFPSVITQTVTPTVTVVVKPSAVVVDHKDDEDEDDEDKDDEDDVFEDFTKRSKLPQILVFDEDGTTRVIISGDGYNDVNASLSSSCLWSLNWPLSILDNTKREDIVFIGFQFWVLGMSIVALLNESIPHMFASLLTHIMATAWAAFQIAHTANFRSTFNRVITNGACNGVALLPNYWTVRANAEYPALALNVVSLLISAFLTWKLVKSFGWQTFKRVGASLTINRIYKLVLVLSIVLQLSFFFMGATVSLWLDNLFNGVASQMASYIPLYKAVSFATLMLLIPWIGSGWFAVRQERRLPMFIFLVLCLLYIGAWSVMFLADTFRWSFLTWRFFSLMASASVLFTLIAFILGVICRYNFGKGLPRYLNVQEPLPGDDFVPVNNASDIEKVAFPSNEKPIPTYSATFGSGAEVPPPSQMFSSRGTRLGPRFYNSSAEPFETPTESIVTVPSLALTRESSQSSGHTHSDSFGTIDTKRWIIE